MLLIDEIANGLDDYLGIVISDMFIYKLLDGLEAGGVREFHTGIWKISIARSLACPILYFISMSKEIDEEEFIYDE